MQQCESCLRRHPSSVGGSPTRRAVHPSSRSQMPTTRRETRCRRARDPMLAAGVRRALGRGPIQQHGVPCAPPLLARHTSAREVGHGRSIHPAAPRHNVSKDAGGPPVHAVFHAHAFRAMARHEPFFVMSVSFFGGPLSVSQLMSSSPPPLASGRVPSITRPPFGFAFCLVGFERARPQNGG